jgi:beta-galactosidase
MGQRPQPGEIPGKIPVNGLYIPECWIKTSDTLIIYDKDGKTPEEVKIEAEPAASREVSAYISQQ